MTTAIILAGGLGTRLRSAVPDLPKPMAPIAGRPFLAHQMDHWIGQGVSRFVLSVGYRHEAISSHFGRRFHGAAIDYVVETSPLGTGGAVKLATAGLPRDEYTLLLNGDTYFDVPLRGRDEITELTHSFNQMIREVKEARDRIVYLEKVSGWQEFARRLAHEIKNPLTPIQLAIQELRRRVPDGVPELKKFVEDAASMVEEEIAALTRLVDEFSQFARLPEVQPEQVELRGFLEEFLVAYNRFEPDAEVVVEQPSEPVSALLDRVLMRRVLANLVTNAIQAAGAGKAKVWIRVKARDGGVEIRVADNGPGVAEENVARIFDPYFTTKSDGTGLGLAIVKKIVLQHGGTIGAYRAVEGGAEMVLLLPVTKPAPPPVMSLG